MSYDSSHKLDSACSKVIFNFQDKTYSPFQQKIYLISLANNPNQLIRIEGFTDDEEKTPYVKYRVSDIDNLFHLHKE